MSGQGVSRSISGWTIFSCVSVALVLLCVSVDLPRLFGPPENAGGFGDMFGIANALFSGLAFVGLVLTLFLQRQEVSPQREELKLTREEMALAREESARTARAAELSARLSALSQLVAYHKSEEEKFAKWAFRSVRDSNAPGGEREDVIDEHAEATFASHRASRSRFLNEIVAVYSELQLLSQPAAAA